jgi:cation transport ATPase
VPAAGFSAAFGDREYHYCCAGCRMVFTTLMEAADAPDPSQLLDLIAWAARVDREVHQNLWCTVGYNAVSIPVAMAGWLNPLMAVGAMLLSSLTVIGNTLLLNAKGLR